MLHYLYLILGACCPVGTVDRKIIDQTEESSCGQFKMNKKEYCFRDKAGCPFSVPNCRKETLGTLRDYYYHYTTGISNCQEFCNDSYTVSGDISHYVRLINLSESKTSINRTKCYNISIPNSKYNYSLYKNGEEQLAFTVSQIEKKLKIEGHDSVAFYYDNGNVTSKSLVDSYLNNFSTVVLVGTEEEIQCDGYRYFDQCYDDCPEEDLYYISSAGSGQKLSVMSCVDQCSRGQFNKSCMSSCNFAFIDKGGPEEEWWCYFNRTFSKRGFAMTNCSYNCNRTTLNTEHNFYYICLDNPQKTYKNFWLCSNLSCVPNCSNNTYGVKQFSLSEFEEEVSGNVNMCAPFCPKVNKKTLTRVDTFECVSQQKCIDVNGTVFGDYCLESQCKNSSWYRQSITNLSCVEKCSLLEWKLQLNNVKYCGKIDVLSLEKIVPPVIFGVLFVVGFVYLVKYLVKKAKKKPVGDEDE